MNRPYNPPTVLPNLRTLGIMAVRKRWGAQPAAKEAHG